VIIVLDPAITPDRRAAIAAFLGDRGVTVRESRAPRGDLVVVTSNPVGLTVEEIQSQAGVLRAVLAGEEFVHAAREFHPTDSVIRVGGVDIGGPSLLLAAGPCAVESEAQMEACARAVSAAGGKVLRGGSFKPRTSPYSFQGLGAEGLRIHREVADRHGLLMMSEVLDREDLALVAGVADILQVGSRNMQNFPLLKALGKQGKPVLLKRGLASNREEILLAAENIL